MLTNLERHNPPLKKNREAVSEWFLRLYTAGAQLKSAVALRNLKRLCEKHLRGHYHIEVIDLAKKPDIARRDNISAVPTVVRTEPSPSRQIAGDLSVPERVVALLNLPPEIVETAAQKSLTS